ncbi:MAG: class B sortase [Propionibacteriaceae bacterium]|jgi:sortase B|nr:class B sortase [Propionibacteriaceae bacterium]
MSKRSNRASRRVRLVYAGLISLFLVVAIVAASQLIPTWLQYRQADEEYLDLRQYGPAVPIPSQDNQLKAELAKIAALLAINPDYIGWLRIPGTNIDYPVVQTTDNERYLTITFGGEENSSGTVFMDYRQTKGFNGQVAILYGHNRRDGSMFAGLNLFHNPDYLAEHAVVTLTTLDGMTARYKVISARNTTVDDAVFSLTTESPEVIGKYLDQLSLPPNSRLLILATCTDARDLVDRALVIAVRQ